jgi:uncharacterized membrane protein YeaQ/YmgE (transglycosylase-associated protein family)
MGAIRHWTAEMEALARRTMRQAAGYAWMYEHMAANAKRWGDALNILSGVLGALIGTAGLVSIFTDTSTPLWSRIVAAILGFLISLVSALNATWKPSEAQTSSVQTQVGYATMQRDLMYQLAQPRQDRADAQEYMQRTLGNIEQLKVSAPIISTFVRAAYNRKFKNNPIYSPEDSWDTTVADARAAHDALRNRTPRSYDSASDVSDGGRGSDGGRESVDGRESDDDWLYPGPPVAPRGGRPDLDAVLDAYDGAQRRRAHSPSGGDDESPPGSSDGGTPGSGDGGTPGSSDDGPPARG